MTSAAVEAILLLIVRQKVNAMKKSNRLQKPKIRNWAAKAVRDLDGPFRPKVERDRSKVRRKPKHRNRDIDFGQ